MAAKKKLKKVVLDRAAETLRDFQGAYAPAWKQFIESDASRAGMQYLKIQKLERIASLPDEEIEKHGREILSDLRGYLQYENDLSTLADKTDFTIPFEQVEEYRSPEEQAGIEMLTEKKPKRKYG